MLFTRIQASYFTMISRAVSLALTNGTNRAYHNIEHIDGIGSYVISKPVMSDYNM